MHRVCLRLRIRTAASSRFPRRGWPCCPLPLEPLFWLWPRGPLLFTLPPLSTLSFIVASSSISVPDSLSPPSFPSNWGIGVSPLSPTVVSPSPPAAPSFPLTGEGALAGEEPPTGEKVPSAGGGGAHRGGCPSRRGGANRGGCTSRGRDTSQEGAHQQEKGCQQ
jgi:hypothetical protein